MKMFKIMLAVPVILGLTFGSASADSVDGIPLIDIFSITDNSSKFGGITLEITQNTDFSDWYGINVGPLGFGNTEVDTKSSAGQTAVATNGTNIAIWNAVEVGGIWTKGDLVALETPATGANQLLATLLTGQNYLFNHYGTLLFDASQDPSQTAQASFRIDPKVVPVPAAVWLFGTALLGLIGFKRKAASVAAAA